MKMNTFLSDLQSALDTLLHEKDSIHVLEAGCGSLSHIKFNNIVHITGIDISRKQLDRNMILDHKILGDLQYFNYKPSSFDLVVCWDVLEHLKYPELALDGFVTSLKNNGIIVLKLPNVFSIKGLLTKYTPLTFHRLVYKHIYRSKRMLKAEFGPFKTFLQYSISPGALKKYAFKSSLKLIYLNSEDISNNNLMIKNKIILMCYKCLKNFLYFLSFKKIGDSDFIIVLQK